MEFKDINKLFKELYKKGFDIDFHTIIYSNADLAEEGTKAVEEEYGGATGLAGEINVKYPEGLEKITLEFNPSEIKGILTHNDGNTYEFYIDIRKQEIQIFDPVRDKIVDVFSNNNFDVE
jgi:hypothetical protein